MPSTKQNIKVQAIYGKDRWLKTTCFFLLYLSYLTHFHYLPAACGQWQLHTCSKLVLYWQGFPTSVLGHFGWNTSLFGELPVHCGRCSHSPNPYLLNAHSTSSAGKTRMSPDSGKDPLGGKIATFRTTAFIFYNLWKPGSPCNGKHMWLLWSRTVRNWVKTAVGV